MPSFFYPLINWKTSNGLFWRLQCLGWGMTAILSLLIALRSYPFIWPVLLTGLAHTVFGFAMTSLLFRPLLRAVRHRGWSLVPVTLFIVGLSTLTGWADHSVMAPWARQAVGSDESFDYFLATGAPRRAILYLFWCASYFGIRYWLDTRETYLRMARLETEKRTAELQLLRAQVNPHFLFNALNSIQAEADNPAKIHALTQGLAEYLRFSLQQEDGIQLLGAELEALEHYLQVEKIRFEENLEVHVEVEATLRQLAVPSALIQPLLENAIKYGQRTSPPPLQISIRGWQESGWLQIEVANSGAWIEPSQERVGIGLSNLRKRLNLLYGEDCNLSVEPTDGWVRACVRLPLKTLLAQAMDHHSPQEARHEYR